MSYYAKILLSLCLVGLTVAGPAHADWELALDTDPMTDDKTGFVSVDNEDSTYGLALKCWNDKEKIPIV